MQNKNKQGMNRETNLLEIFKEKFGPVFSMQTDQCQPELMRKIKVRSFLVVHPSVLICGHF